MSACAGPERGPQREVVAPVSTASWRPANANLPSEAAILPDTPPSACASREAELAKVYASVADAFGSWGYALSADGKKLLFESNRGGRASQLYIASTESPTSAVRIVGDSPDRIGGARFTPDGKTIIFWRDHNGDDNPQLFRSSVDGGEGTAIDPDPSRFHHEPQLAPNAKQLVYFRGDHKSGTFELVKTPLEGGTPTSIAVGKRLHGLRAVNRSATSGLGTHLFSQSKGEVLRFDLKSGKTEVLAPRDKSDSFAHTGAFSSDEKSIYVVSNEGRERFAVERLDATTSKVLATFADDRVDVEAVRVAPNGNLIAVECSNGSYNTIELLDAFTLQRKVKVDLPPASIRLGEFQTNGRALVVSLSMPSVPSEVFAVDAITGKVRKLREDDRGVAISPLNVTTEMVKSFDGTIIPTNVYVPADHKGEKLPVIIKIHGGPGGSYRVRWSDYTTFYLANGFAVVEPNVRGSTGFGKAYERADNGTLRMDAVKDLEYVNAWLRAQPWADSSKLVLQGGSYGGYLTYMALGHQPKLWAAGIAMFGVVNFATLFASVTGVYRDALHEEFAGKAGDAFLASISPLRVADRIEAPLFVYQGQNDVRTKRSEQDQMVALLRKRGTAVEYMVAPDEGHDLAKRNNRIEFHSRSIRFIEQQIGLGEASTCDRSAGKPPAR